MTAELKKLNGDQLRELIIDLSGTPRALVGSDGGTHGQPDQHNIYEEVTGERYAVYSFSGANGTRCTEEQAKAETNGRILIFTGAQSEIRAKARQLAEAKKLLTALGH